MGTRLDELQNDFVDYTLSFLNQGILNYEFNILLSLRDDTNPRVIAYNLNDFYQYTQENLDKLAQILEQDDVNFSNIDRILQAFRDSSSIIGAEGFLSTCVEFRINSHAKDKEGCLSCLEQTRKAYNMLKSNLETLFELEEQIVATGGSIPKPSVNETMGTKVAQLQFEYADYTSSLMDERILIVESNPKFEAQNLNIVFREVPRVLDDLADTVNLLNETGNFNYNINWVVTDTIRRMVRILDSSSVGAIALVPVRNAFKQLRTCYKKRNMEGCFESLKQARNEFNLLQNKLEPIVEMEKNIVAAGGSIPKPIVKDTRRIGALDPSERFIIGLDTKF